MCEEEVDRSVRLYMMSMDLSPSQEGFQMLAKAIVLRIYYGLPRIKIYEMLGIEFQKSRRGIERSMHKCIAKLDKNKRQDIMGRW